MNIAAIQALVQQRSGHSPVTLDDTAVRPLSDLLGHPDINDYVRHCLPQKTYLASKNQLAVQCLNGIIDEMHPKCSPWRLCQAIRLSLYCELRRRKRSVLSFADRKSVLGGSRNIRA